MMCLLLNMGISPMARLVYQRVVFTYISKITRVQTGQCSPDRLVQALQHPPLGWWGTHVAMVGVCSGLSINGIAQLKEDFLKPWWFEWLNVINWWITSTLNPIIQAMYPAPPSWEQSGLARQGDANSLHQTLWHPNTSPSTMLVQHTEV